MKIKSYITEGNPEKGMALSFEFGNPYVDIRESYWTIVSIFLSTDLRCYPGFRIIT